MPDEQGGFQVGDEFYPWANSFTMGDAMLVPILTGIDFDEWMLMVQDLGEDGEGRVRAMVGLVGVAVWHQNPTWKMDRVVRFVQQIDMSQFTIPESEKPESEDDALPPETEPESSASTAAAPISSGESSDENGEPSPASVSQLRSGFPVSVTGSGSGHLTSETSRPSS